MLRRIIDSYQPCYNTEIREKLREKKAKDFTLGIANYAKKMFVHFNDSVGYDITLDYTSLGIALNSAYIDIYISTFLHEMDGGPSPSKHGAAIASWINIIKPMQFPNGSQESCVYINSHWALLTGLMVKFQMEERKGALYEVLHENKKLNALIYTLVWRNPSYKELTTLFQFI
ncbi:MAG: hypothetical protein Q9M26_09265 [Mariprofundales bacterium]|nr:hypothetical protein [Mariprofundales bacterium]